ncbi:glycosyltransferase family 4 protein [Nostoc sp.]|uniref:glycosyltransferase family 4 protein n=2 Tax=Nostoc sp. TaxID=1180 RepID=UPI002FFAC857
MNRKILYWIDFFLPHIGGSEIFSASLIPALQERGYEIEIVTSSEVEGFREWDGNSEISIHRFPFWNALKNGNLQQMILLRKQITEFKKKFQPDLVHLHFGAASYFHLQTLNAYPAPTLTTIHSCPEICSSPQSLLNRTLQATQWLTTVSAQELANIRKFDPSVSARSSLIYYGVELPKLPPRPLNIDTPKLLCLGRLVPNKGFDIALQALALLINRFPKLRMIIGGDGTAKADLMQQSVDMGLGNVVEFRGWVDNAEVPALLNEVTIVLIPSRQMEGLPLVAIQAAQMARPIVATAVNGLPELIVHQQTGLLIELEDSVSLAEAITYFLENPVLANQMGQAARQKVQENFDLKNCINHYDALYQELSGVAIKSQLPAP